MHRFTPQYVLAAVASVALVSACARSPRAVQNDGAAVGSGAMASAARSALPAAVTPANVALGDSLFNSGGCQRCHGMKGVGAANGPALDGQKWVQLKTGSFDEIAGIITTGVPAAAIKDPTRRNAMQPRGGRMQLTDPQIQAVAAYVYSLTHR